MSTSVKKNLMPPGLVSNLQQALLARNASAAASEESPESVGDGDDAAENSSKPVLLVTNANGIDFPGLTCLIEALVLQGLYNVYVCAPQSDKSVSAHSMTFQETVAVSAAQINGAAAFEVSGTPVDCVSLALSGALFSWSKPLMVISGINSGASCGNHMFYSGVVAGAREALICGVPSISLSLNWKKDESEENNFKEAVTVCLPLIKAAIRDIEKGVFPKSCSLNIDIPTSPLANKGFKLTKPSLWRPTPCWQAVSAKKNPVPFMSGHQSLGIQLAQLGRDASAAGAARRMSTQSKNLEEVESVGVAGKSDSKVKKYFRLEFLEKEQEVVDEDLDFRALENGFVSVTPLSISSHMNPDTLLATSDWIASALHGNEVSQPT